MTETTGLNVLYTATAHATGDGRNGHATTDDGRLDLDLRIPKEMGGPGGATNPEQLFAVGYAACFHSALKVVGKGRGLDVDGSEVSASVGIGALPDGGFGLAVELDVHLPALDLATAQSLAADAHQVCPYSNATRGNIEVTLTVV
jgi:Ohr subfamily peroxiredoxin